MNLTQFKLKLKNLFNTRLRSCREDLSKSNKRYNKLKKDYWELESKLKEQLPQNEIKTCDCGGYIFKLGKSYVHLARRNCGQADGLSVELVVLDEALQSRLKEYAGDLKDLTRLNQNEK